MGKRICSVPACDAPARGHGLCSRHYQRVRNLGEVGGVASLRRKTFDHPPAKPGCLEWQGYRDAWGYGTVHFGPPNPNGRGRLAVHLHRWIFEQVEGPLEPGELVRHTCDNPPCFRYSHLLRGTPLDNMRDMDERGRRVVVSLPGESCPASKITKSDVRRIRSLHSDGMPHTRIALLFGVSRTCVRDIIRGHTWSSVT